MGIVAAQRGIPSLPLELQVDYPWRLEVHPPRTPQPPHQRNGLVHHRSQNQRCRRYISASCFQTSTRYVDALQKTSGPKPLQNPGLNNQRIPEALDFNRSIWSSQKTAGSLSASPALSRLGGSLEGAEIHRLGRPFKTRTLMRPRRGFRRL